MRTVVLGASLVLLVSSTAGATGTGTLGFTAIFQATERVEPCPPGHPAQSTTCYAFTSSAIVRGLGFVTITQRNIVDNPGTFRLRVSGTFAVRGMGELSYAGDNSAHPGRNTFDFTFSAGTATLAGATGGGTVTNALTATARAFWEASVVAPSVAFDLVPPSLAVTKVTASRSGSKLRLRIGYRVADSSAPVVLRAVVGRTVASANARATGVVSLLVPAPAKGTRLTGRLTATDGVGNAVARGFSVRV